MVGDGLISVSYFAWEVTKMYDYNRTSFNTSGGIIISDMKDKDNHLVFYVKPGKYKVCIDDSFNYDELDLFDEYCGNQVFPERIFIVNEEDKYVYGKLRNDSEDLEMYTMNFITEENGEKLYTEGSIIVSDKDEYKSKFKKDKQNFRFLKWHGYSLPTGLDGILSNTFASINIFTGKDKDGIVTGLCISFNA